MHVAAAACVHFFRRHVLSVRRAVVIPSYRASTSIMGVIAGIGPEVQLIVVVDDCCPEQTGAVVTRECRDPRVHVIKNPENRGVGGAFLAGAQYALQNGATVIIKVDADGQMNPKLISAMVKPIESGVADFVKGNRFFFLSHSRQMPRVRRFGNLGLSFLTKMSSGYWNIMDPTNGFFAIEARVAALLPSDKISKRFFFESDLLFHLGLLRAKVVDFPMQAVYGAEVSNLAPSHMFWPFLRGNLRNFFWRILYKYFLRDFSLASIELVTGGLLLLLGLVFGLYHWIHGAMTGTFVPTGTIMLVALALMIGFQLLLAFLNYDVSTVPRDPLHPLLDEDTSRIGNLDRGPEDAKQSAKLSADARPVAPARVLE
jgi:dolichol-phosphate mannosyltransferase